MVFTTERFLEVAIESRPEWTHDDCILLKRSNTLWSILNLFYKYIYKSQKPLSLSISQYDIQYIYIEREIERDRDRYIYRER